MDFLNKIELKGVVGRVNVQNVGGKEYANISLVTEHVYKDTNNEGSVIETMWHYVVAWNIPEGIDKGSKIHVVGRLRARRYTDSEGVDRNMVEVVANKIEVIDED